MSSLLKNIVVVALLGTAIRVDAAITVEVDTGKTWVGYMNVSELPENGGAAMFSSAWAPADLRANFTGLTLTLTPNAIADVSDYWYQGGGAPGHPGNKTMDANMYVEDSATLPGELVTFKGEVLDNTLVSPYTSKAFIKDFAPDYSSFNAVYADLVKGAFSIDLQTTPGNHVQYGFETVGPCVWATDLATKGQVDIKAVQSGSGESITINPANATACEVTGQASSALATTPAKGADGVISYFYSGGWVEIPFTVVTPGIYDASFDVYTPVANCTAQIDVSRVGSGVHYATDDIAVPTTGAWGTVGTATVAGIPILQAGDYLLRVRNTRLIHNNTAANREPGYEKDAGGVFRDTAFNLGIITLNRAGDAPAAGTVSGTVKSADLGGTPVVGAYVMANSGAEVPEPGPFWQKGFWSTTGADGSYTLPALTGSNKVQAGLPSMYAFSGTPVSDVTVANGAASTANLNLPSRFTKTDGKYSVRVESEYFTGKIPDTFNAAPGTYQASPVVIQGRAINSNGMMCGFIDIGNYVDIPVDIPAGQGGDYSLSDIVFNGFWNGVDFKDALTRFTANKGTADESVTQMVEPNTTPKDPDTGAYLGGPDGGYTNQATYAFTNPLRLKAGHNIVRIESLDDPQTAGNYASSAWDAFTLVQMNVPPSASRALRIAAGLESAPAPASGAEFIALNAATTGSSSTVIDIADAIALAKAGNL